MGGEDNYYDQAVAQSHAHPIQQPFPHASVNGNTEGFGHEITANTEDANGRLQVVCGPLLNYKRMSMKPGSSSSPEWHGSVLIVVKPSEVLPKLQLSYVGENQYSNDTKSSQLVEATSRQATTFEGEKLYEDLTKTFWRFRIQLNLTDREACWSYTIPELHMASTAKPRSSWHFYVPPAQESMRIMFHSCNGFSVGTDEDAWSGPALWNDVLRTHEKRPFHVMIGGGDQIYNDGVRVDGPLKEWTAISNPHKRRNHPFPESLRAACDDYYFNNYKRWYSTEPFASANGQIPQINIFDDHDIIDGFGSYTDHFMQCPVFRGIGGVAFKYYSLFQQHIPPPKSTFTTDAPQTLSAGADGTAGADPRQLNNTFVMKEEIEDRSWIIGKRPGPYVEEMSRSLYMRLGRHMAFIGVDARTERTRHQINYPDTYDLIFSRLENEVTKAQGEIKHLILLLGVPIAYPRLAWLENILTSPLIAPIRLLNKRFGLGGGLFNKFDGQVDLLDDLDDHYTARQHKDERRELIQRLQGFAQQYDVRITILGGDVHLAAVGRFYSKPKLDIPSNHDHRYMANIVSSAITNKPPPAAVANLLAKRNKIHHLDGDTDETLLKFFNEQPGGQMKGSKSNQCTMPSRNYATITPIKPIVEQPHSLQARPSQNPITENISPKATGKDGHTTLHRGEEGAGTQHAAADGISNTSGMDGGLDISIQVEISNSDREGKTEGYGFSIPGLTSLKSSHGNGMLTA